MKVGGKLANWPSISDEAAGAAIIDSSPATGMEWEDLLVAVPVTFGQQLKSFEVMFIKAIR